MAGAILAQIPAGVSCNTFQPLQEEVGVGGSMAGLGRGAWLVTPPAWLTWSEGLQQCLPAAPGGGTLQPPQHLQTPHDVQGMQEGE